ncbi:glycerol-3-phosphate transporter [Thermoplasma volcanium GSS1]|uniref:Glycerol-3-phosphate transporter n=1 Tax=Thermoplasma volcanium (strain ATCC 51530 / DSM 4299 / JCM 9571 / NBRC 15438 / GSS1) TaxID=273116 RepID=Q97B97_THEVO|nr:MFS transporter [Thermoplasma volcanium]BAB59702.1 glycerol-3-phosphate transporter [Thermoplasma volcanium GSS1]
MESSMKFGRPERIKALTFTSLGHFTNDFNILLFSVLITYYHRYFGISLALLGAIAIIYNIISGFLSTPIGRYADKTRAYRGLMMLGIFILGVSLFLFGFSFLSASFVIWIMLIAVIFLGIGQAFYHPLGGSILNVTYGERAASALGINGAFGSIGRSALPVILVPLILLVGKAYALFVAGTYMFVAGVVIYAGLSFLKKREIPNRSREASSAANKETYLRYRGVLAIIVAMIFIRAMFLTGTTTYISQFVLDRVKSEILMSYILTISFLTAVIGQPVFGRLTEKYGGKWSISITTILSTLFFIFFMLSGDNAVLDTVTYAAFVFMAFTGFPVLMGYVNQIVPNNISTTANGLVWGLGNTVGGGIGIAVMSIFLNLHFTLTSVMWIMIIFGVISAFFIPLIPGVKRSAELKSGSPL